MADYYPLIARAVEGLSDRSPEMRRAVYERARTALIGQLRSIDPPLSDAHIEQERISLDAAIDRVEAEYVPAAAAALSHPTNCCLDTCCRPNRTTGWKTLTPGPGPGGCRERDGA